MNTTAVLPAEELMELEKEAAELGNELDDVNHLIHALTTQADETRRQLRDVQIRIKRVCNGLAAAVGAAQGAYKQREEILCRLGDAIGIPVAAVRNTARTHDPHIPDPLPRPPGPFHVLGLSYKRKRLIDGDTPPPPSTPMSSRYSSSEMTTDEEPPAEGQLPAADEELPAGGAAAGS